jgi:ketosteroid isomerase-like protein
MHPHGSLIARFYEAFSRRDAQAMIACYHPEIAFSDPVFPELRGDHARAMWQMLCERGKGLRIEFNQVDADERQGRAHWEACYTFSATGRRVHNRIDARFDFQDGRISHHHDSFSFWRWASQALGPIGIVAGWSPMVRHKVRRQAAANLERYLARTKA